MRNDEARRRPGRKDSAEPKGERFSQITAGVGEPLNGQKTSVFEKLVNLVKYKRPKHHLPGWPKERGFDLFIPSGENTRVPLVIAIHGYTHDGYQMRTLTCSNGDPESPDSLEALAEKEKFAVVFPYGTRIKALPGRCWNAGGGINGFAPVGEPARRRKVDDVRFFRELLDHLPNHLNFDPDRVYLVGMSNGGAMAQRLAMEAGELWAAVATVAGCNQYAGALGIEPTEPMSLLHIHGTEDTIWPYLGGKLAAVGTMHSVEDSLAGWIQANQASKWEELILPAVNRHDSTRIHRTAYRNRESGNEVEFYKIEGGGHAWPSGFQYLPHNIMGTVTSQMSANKVIWRFLKRHRRG